MPAETQVSKADFLCIGAPKCGTTWLHNLLTEHPSVYLPKQIKEIHYFDRYRERGDRWYNAFFSGKDESQIAGDVTPHYLYAEDLEYIKKYNPNIKLILIYRNPVDRCVSHYKYRQRLDNFNGNFRDFLQQYPQAIEWSLYGKYLSKYLDVFASEQILTIEFENAVSNVGDFKNTIASFLGIDSSAFPEGSGNSKVNHDIVVKNGTIYRISVKLSKLMVDYNLYSLRHVVRKLLLPIIKREFKGEMRQTTISTDELNILAKRFEADQQHLSNLLNKVNKEHVSAPNSTVTTS